jgi:arginine deiminase
VSALGVNTAVGPTGTIRASGDISSGYSDVRLKTNIQTIENGLNKVLKLSGIYYTPNKLAKDYGFNENDKQVGLIAQQVEVVAPEIISIAPFDSNENEKSNSGMNFMTVKYELVVPLLIEAVKEQQTMINSLLDKVDRDDR